MIRFLIFWIPATVVLFISFVFPESKSGEFGISRSMVRKIAFWMVGFQEFCR